MHIGTLTARSGWLVPTFTLTDVTLQDAQGRTALRLPKVVAALSPRSLLHLGFEQLYLEAPELDVRRAADGQIFVAGRPLKASGRPDNRGADWLFSQAEVLVRNATVRWTDERAASPTVALGQVEILLRNSPWHHAMRIAATPPTEWGDRIDLVGEFSQPLLSLRPGNWHDWSGPLYADLPRVDIGRLQAAVGPLAGLGHADGVGSVRAWADIAQGEVAGATADLALDRLDLQFAAAPGPLALQHLSGRLSGHRGAHGFDIGTQRLAFTGANGQAWPGGNLLLRQREALHGLPGHTELRADRLDLAALAAIARGLPLSTALQNALAERAPAGQLESLDAEWEDDAARYQARGRVVGLALAAIQPDSSRLAAAAAVEAAMRALDPHGHRHVHPPIGRPGVRGADVDFDLSETGGKARMVIASGAFDFPGVFEEPVVPLDSFEADLRWQRSADGRLKVQVPQARFANADAAGELQASWHMNDEADPDLRLPGVLDLSGHLSRADGTRVWRYLPQSIGPEVRRYVRDAVSAGAASAVQFQVRGDLRHMPFADPRLGLFRVAAQLHDVTYAYAPPEVEPAGALPWPALVGLDGELVFEGRSMDIRNASGRLESPASLQATGARGADAPAPHTARTPALRAGGVQVVKVDARIPDLSHSVVAVQARARGPLGEMLDIVNAAPLARLTNHALAHADAQGNAELLLGLSLPLAEMHRSTVKGSVVLGGNDLRITPQSPLLGHARGTVAFTESGFTLVGTQAQMLGGDVQVQGGLKPIPGAVPGTGVATHVLALQAQGTLTAEGLRAAPEIGATARLAESASGSTAYTFSVNTTDGHPEVTVDSDLQGLALDFPAPLGKAAEARLPLVFQTRLLPRAGEEALRDELTMRLGDVVSVRFQRALDGARPRVLAGSLAIGLDARQPAPLPKDGVAAQVRLALLDVDAWRGVLRQVGEQGAATAAAGPVAAEGAQRSESADYLPDTLSLQADELTAAGRTLHQVVVDGSHHEGLWQAHVDARELGGTVEYRQATAAAPAKFYARLARLQVPETAVQDVETLTDDHEMVTASPAPSSASPAPAPASALPALDIVVDDFQLKDRNLGRLEVQAVNRDAEWRLDKLQITLPEATFAASGRWGRRSPGTPRRTEMAFQLDLRDTGALLGRLGMPGVVARGAGQLGGTVDWVGSPFSPDYGSMDGSLRLDVASGQFLKADPGLAKLLGVLSLQSLPRRLTLDFRDVFSRGFAFDSVRGDVAIDDGIARTDRLEMKGVAASVRMDGSADIRRETQNLRVVVVPEIDVRTASLLATFIHPVIGLSTFLAQGVLRGPLNRAATQEFDITGRWDAPKIVKLTGSARTAPH